MSEEYIKKALSEFDLMTEDNDELQDKIDYVYTNGLNKVSCWLKENTDKHLYEDCVYNEPMLDLSTNKVRCFLELQIRNAVEMTKEKLTLEQRHLQGILGDDDYLIDVGYNQAVQDLEELKKQI